MEDVTGREGADLYTCGGWDMGGLDSRKVRYNFATRFEGQFGFNLSNSGRFVEGRPFRNGRLDMVDFTIL